MAHSKRYPLRVAIMIWSGLYFGITGGCVPTSGELPRAAPVTPEASVTATMQCEEQLVPPQIMKIQPAEPTAGSEILIIGSGGYIQDTCGGYIEGRRDFELFLDSEPAGDLSCYANRCEGRIVLPSTISMGSHCLSTEVETCQFEFEITTN